MMCTVSNESPTTKKRTINPTVANDNQRLNRFNSLSFVQAKRIKSLGSVRCSGAYRDRLLSFKRKALRGYCWSVKKDPETNLMATFNMMLSAQSQHNMNEVIKKGNKTHLCMVTSRFFVSKRPRPTYGFIGATDNIGPLNSTASFTWTAGSIIRSRRSFLAFFMSLE
jgi:hypothetical protein